jgi:hypothetical protein
MQIIDFSKITACGECCVGCVKKEQGICKGCIETDGNCKEWEDSEGCPIYKCARQHSVQFCGLCNEFPCEFLVKKVTWNHNIIEHLTELRNKFHMHNMIIELELSLLDEKIRNNKNELEKILSKEFIEYGFSGKIYDYDITLNMLPNKSDKKIEYKIIENRVNELSENIVLLLYIIEMEIMGEIHRSNRSSIWKREEDNWKIIFHQGTKAERI